MITPGITFYIRRRKIIVESFRILHNGQEYWNCKSPNGMITLRAKTIEYHLKRQNER